MPASPGSMNFTTRPLTAQTWPDLEAIFNARGCSVARGCWCMCYRRSGTSELPSAHSGRARQSKEELRALADAGAQVGLIGYRDGVPVATLSAGKVDFLTTLDSASRWEAEKRLVRSAARGLLSQLS